MFHVFIILAEKVKKGKPRRAPCGGDNGRAHPKIHILYTLPLQACDIIIVYLFVETELLRWEELMATELQNREVEAPLAEVGSDEVASIADAEAAQEQAQIESEQDFKARLAAPTAAPTEPSAPQDEVRWQPKKRRRRFGDRRDGRRLRSLCPVNYVSPFIMDTRIGASNMITDRIDVAAIEQYLREKKQEGHSMTLMHVLIAAYVRTVASYPGINRFLSGQRIYARNSIEVMLTIKKEMAITAPETVVKAFFRPDDTIYDVEAEFNRLIEEYREDDSSALDGVAKILMKIPRIFLRGTVSFLRFLDYFGWLPRALTRVSCFHGSFFITSMGSLGIPPIYHHLYDFGNVPTFMSFGAKQRRNVILDDGTVKKEHYVDFTIVMDERICDGYYYATALKHLKKILKNPWVLDTRPDEVQEDVE